jgi:hypothetical protein
MASHGLKSQVSMRRCSKKIASREEERTLVITGLGLPSLSKSEVSMRQTAREKGDRGRWSRGLAEQALELVKGDRGPNGFQKIRSLSHKNQAVFKKSARFIIFS